MVRAHIYFSGTVQGVGFRYTCQSYAVELDLKGWVKNLSDGRVELLAEGTKIAIVELVKKSNDHFGGYIHNVQTDYLDASGEFKDFKVAF